MRNGFFFFFGFACLAKSVLGCLANGPHTNCIAFDYFHIFPRFLKTKCRNSKFSKIYCRFKQWLVTTAESNSGWSPPSGQAQPTF
jgi:hypothetical protein